MSYLCINKIKKQKIMATTNITFGKSFEYLGYECKPFINNDFAEDFGLDIYDNGQYLMTCPEMTQESISYESLRKEFKLNGIQDNLWERYNEKQFGKNWRDIYNGL